MNDERDWVESKRCQSMTCIRPGFRNGGHENTKARKELPVLSGFRDPVGTVFGPRLSGGSRAMTGKPNVLRRFVVRFRVFVSSWRFYLGIRDQKATGSNPSRLIRPCESDCPLFDDELGSRGVVFGFELEEVDARSERRTTNDKRRSAGIVVAAGQRTDQLASHVIHLQADIARLRE